MLRKGGKWRGGEHPPGKGANLETCQSRCWAALAQRLIRDSGGDPTTRRARREECGYALWLDFLGGCLFGGLREPFQEIGFQLGHGALGLIGQGVDVDGTALQTGPLR